MRFIITSGATFEKWDDVRGITNLSQGTTGAKIAEEALKQGHSVDYISNKNTKKPFEIKLTPNNLDDINKIIQYKNMYNKYKYYEAKNFTEYEKQCKSATKQKINEKIVFISAAAVSDYIPIPSSGKISSNTNVNIPLKVAPKIINEIKNDNPLIPIVGFKLLSEKDHSLSSLIEVAYKSLLKSKMALIVANLIDEDFKLTKTIIITPEKNIIPVNNRNDLSTILVKTIEDRINTNFYKSKKIGNFPSNIDLKPFFKLVSDSSHYSLFSLYGEGRKDAEFGSVGMRTQNGIIVSGRGSTKKNINEDDLAFINDIKDNNIYISSNGIKATLNASTLWHIFKDREDINFIVHSHVYLSNGTFINKQAAPSTLDDYSIIKEAVCSGYNVINQVGHGCFILLNKENDLLDILKNNGLYNSPYSEYYDIAYYRFKSGILEETIKHLNLKKDISVLDLACGTGKSSQELINLGFKNIDIADASPNMLTIAEERVNKKGVIAYFEDLNNIKDKYDLITIRQAFSYIQKNKINDFAKNIYNKLNNNGYLILNSFNKIEEQVNSRYDCYEEDNKLIKTLETNIITENEIIHSQRTEFLDYDNNTYIPLYDLNIFNQLDFDEIKMIFENNGFEVKIKLNKKSLCFIARKI